MTHTNAHVAVYPASFDPIHLGHLDIVTRAAAIFDELVLAIYDRPMKTLLFTTEQRVALVAEAVGDLPNVRVETYSGLTIHFAQERGAKVLIRGLRTAADFEREFGMAHLNRTMAQDVEVMCLMASPQYSFVSSSAVKEIAALGGTISEMVPPHVERALQGVYGPRSER